MSATRMLLVGVVYKYRQGQTKRCVYELLFYSGGFRVVPRVPWNPFFMKVLIIILLYYGKLTRSVGPVDYNSPNGTPYLMSSKIILTVAHLQVLWSEFWSPRAQQTTQNTPFSIASGCGQRKNERGQKIARAPRAFFMLTTPLYKILNPPLFYCSYYRSSLFKPRSNL